MSYIHDTSEPYEIIGKSIPLDSVLILILMLIIFVL